MLRFGSIIAGVLLVCGCRMSAPMHVWKEPQLAGGSTLIVAVAPVGGPNEITEKLDQSLIATRPQTIPQLAVLYPDQLEKISGIQLVSYDGQPSEMASFGAAKRAGAQYILSGEILQHDLAPRQEQRKPRLLSWLKKKQPDESISIRWTVFDGQSGSRLGEKTIYMDTQRAVGDYPDLAYHGSPDMKVISASARRSWEMVVPTTSATQATLDLPWLMPGSSRVRKGNAYARLGQWEQAEREWQEAADVHPWNRAAWHNLSMAAVAKEDFQLARDRLTHAEAKWIPGDQTAKSATWIDSIEREHDACFDPEPPSTLGQRPLGPANLNHSKVGAPPRMPPNPEFQPMQDGQSTTGVKPRSLDDQPWYTIIPFMPPPGWSWSNWWYQSTLF